MTMLFQLPIDPVSGAAPAYSAAEDALLDSPDLLAWWSARDGNYSLTGGPWADRKYGLLAALVDPSKRPTQTAIGARPVMKTGATTDPTAVWVTNDSILPADQWTIFAVTDGHGNSPLASAFSVVGNDGGALGLRTRSSNIVSVNIDAGAAIGSLTATLTNTNLPHLYELGYLAEGNQGYVYRDGGPIGIGGTLTGWAQLTGRIAFASVYDVVDGIVAYGRSIGIAELMIARVSALGSGTGMRQLVKAVINEQYAGQIAVA